MNTTDLDSDLVSSIATLANAAQTPIVRDREDGTKFALYPDKTLVELSPGKPVRKCGTVSVEDTASFIDYVAKHGTPGTLIALRWDVATLVADAIIDHHSNDDAGWRSHRCIATLSPSAGWAAWLGSNRKNMRQGEFAAFLEDRLLEVSTPPAAEMMEIVTTLEAAQNVRFKSHVRLQNGDRHFVWQGVTEANAGETGELTIPAKFRILVQPYFAASKVLVDARFKYQIGPEGLNLRYELEGIEDLKTQMIADVREALAAKFPDALVVLGKSAL